MKVPYRKCIDSLKAYVPGKSIEEVREMWGLEKIIKMASNENPLGPSSKVISAIQQHASDIFRYPIGDSPELRKALGKLNHLDSSQVVVSNGSDEMVWILSTVFLDPGDEVLSSQPTFSEYQFCGALLDSQYRQIPLKDWRHELNALLEAINDKTKIIYLCNPNNPTGTWSTEIEIAQFMSKVPNNILVVVDQAYQEYANHPEFPRLHDVLIQYPNLVLLRTFSKAYALAGLRVGYSLSSRIIADLLLKVKQPFNVNYLAQVAALAALKDSEHLQKSLELNRQGMAFLTSAFKERGFEVLDSQANFLCFKVGENAKSLVMNLEKRGLVLRHLGSFNLPEWVRVTIGTPQENQIFLEAFDAEIRTS